MLIPFDSKKSLVSFNATVVPSRSYIPSPSNPHCPVYIDGVATSDVNDSNAVERGAQFSC